MQCAIYSPVDAEAQEWQFAYDGEGKFRIFPTANVYALLTANGGSNCTTNGTSINTPGNVYLSELPMSTFAVPTDYQLWYIEEVTSKRTIADGYYKIQNTYGRYLETDLTNNSVYQMTGLNRLNQIWEISYIFGGYYVIRTAANLDRALRVESDYDEMGSTIDTYLLGGQNPTELQKWMQWKIVPNINGGYRIVSISSYDNQVLTTLYDNMPRTPIGQVPYVDAPSQQWSFSKAQCPKKGVTEHADGHVVYLYKKSYPFRYRCAICQAVFKSPEEQDYENNHLSDEDRAIIFALQKAAVLKQIEGGKDHFVEACLRAVDIIRSEQDGHFVYNFSRSDGSYISPYKYTYNANTINASIEVNTITYGTMRQLTNVLTWTIGESLPFPLNLISDIIGSVATTGEGYTYSELIDFALIELIDNNIDLSNSRILDAINTVIAYISLHNSATNFSNANFNKDIVVEINIYDNCTKDMFGGTYRKCTTINAPPLNIVEETFHVHERLATNINKNWFERNYVYDSVGTEITEAFDFLFS